MFGLNPSLQVRNDRLPQIKILSDEVYNSLFMRVFVRAIRMGVIAAIAQAGIDPTFIPSLIALVWGQQWDKAQILLFPVVVAFLTAVEKTWRDASVVPSSS